ncbi:MAG TPA: thiamine pyrophosphate-binding protein, partial [Micromonosporaceae bacterium]|nr:thiamine pyrophosphate-binding protein [Micromonosporaceae bacterium]
MTRPTPETLAHATTRRSRSSAAETRQFRPAPSVAAGGNGTAPANAVGPVETSGAGSLVRSLEELGVEVVFGIPGGAILPAYDPLYDSRVRHILVRHEQGAGHAATGYAQATGKVGVCIATSGPGATNLVTPIA